MAKKVTKIIKLQIPAGKANPAPPVGSALGQHGVAIQDFCNQFKDKTKDQMGTLIPCVISVYEDRSFTFITKSPPASTLIKKELNLKSGSGLSHKNKVGHLTKDQLKKIAEIKMEDLNANDVEQAMKVIAGTARSMGVTTDEI